MCGIAGFVNFSDAGSAGRSASDAATLRSMTDAIRHRGPDGEGHWLSDSGAVGLGHRRLAVIDLSPSGAQPMRSRSGRYVISFNGEIYGFEGLRDELGRGGVAFDGTSDTEVLLAMVETYGIAAALERVTGMFAFALYDREANILVLARDRLGKKPLYIGARGHALVFASEMKALREHPDFADPALDREALADFMRLGYVPAPRSIDRYVVKLPQGHWVEIDCSGTAPSAQSVLSQARTYWDMRVVASDGASERHDDEAVSLDRLEAVLTQAVRERMVSDVPVGAFLSGGIDSTLVTALMTEVSDAPVRTFTVRFEEGSHDEADAARAIADHLGTEHHELTATPEAAMALVDEMPDVFDEPFADASQLPTLLVSRLAHEHVTVALSGDGGDEALGGYARYTRMSGFERRLERVPRMVWNGIDAAPVDLCEAGLKLGRPLLPAAMREEASGDRLKKLARVMQGGNADERYGEFTSIWPPRDRVVRGQGNECTFSLEPGFTGTDRMMLTDALRYLPDDILVKVDRTSMACGLEMRAPLLDHRFVAEAWRAPRSLCIRDGTGKIALRQLLEKRMPTALFDRPKRGFGVPMRDWLRGPLREWADDLVRSVEPDGPLDRARILERWREHLEGRRNWSEQLWTVLMYQAWARRWMANA